MENLSQNLNVYFNKKTLFHTVQYLKQINIFTETFIYMAVDCKSDSRQGKP